ncbi:MAG: hypothetical protein CVV24_07555 [Ignavibacteriae bacterium HGW-Ignavibacteriae-3]|nr:MAG: hypothetical protein CVV24_07555 [Ignavibacteriae bacterium HGW-Ignavibacteriae-3]
MKSLFKREMVTCFIIFSFSMLTVSSVLLADELKLVREKTFQVKEWHNVYVDASGADVKVESWDKEEVYVKVFANRRAVEKMKFDVYQTGEVVKVLAKRKGSIFNWFGGSLNVKIEIMTPRNFNPQVETSGGDIRVANLTGGFKLETSGGDITLINTNGKLTTETSGGDISINNHKGDMYLSTSGGDIVLKETEGNIKAETSGGDIKIDANDGKVFAETSGGSIIINYSGVNKGINASTSGGDIYLKIPSSFKAKVHLETSGGRVSNNFKNSRTDRVKRSLVDAQYNGGGEMLRLETSGGDITVDEK